MSNTAEKEAVSLSLVQRGRGWLAEKLLGPKAKTFLDGVTTGGAFFNRLGVTDSFDGGRLRQPFRYSPWVRAAIKIKSGEISSVPLKFYSGDEEIEDPELEAFWKCPAIGAEGEIIDIADVFEILTGWLDMAGEFFLVLDDTWLAPFPEAGGFHPFIIARPDRMTPIVVNRRLEGWWFTDANRGKTLLLCENVIHKKVWNPYDDIRGLGPIESAMNAAEGDFLASVYIRNLMRNNGDAGPIVTLADGASNLADEQQEQILRALRDRRQAAVNGSFKGMFLNGNVKVESPELQAADANLVATRTFAKHEIFVALGVPPSMSEVTASYSIGAASDRFQLITTTCMALAKKINGAFSRLVRQQTQDANAEAETDWTDHVVMQQVRVGLLSQVETLWSKGMPMRDVSAFLGLGIQEFDGWDVGYMPFSVVPVGTQDIREVTDPNTPPTSPTDTTGNDLQKIIRDMVGAAREMKRVTETGHEEIEIVQLKAIVRQGDPQMIRIPDVILPPLRCIRAKVRNSREAAHLQQHLAKRRVQEKRYQSAIDRELMKARAQTLQKVDSKYSAVSVDRSVVTKDASGLAAQMTFDKTEFKEGLYAEIERVARKTLKIAGDELLSEVNYKSSFMQTPEQVLLFIKKRENLMRDVPDEIHRTVMTEISDGLQRGDTKEELSKAVRSVFNTISDGRAKTIATTEAGAAYGDGRQLAMKQAGVQWKQWLSAEDDKVRPAHAIADGQTVPAQEAYDVDGEELMYPGDSHGDPGNVINCRCVSIVVMEGPDDE